MKKTIICVQCPRSCPLAVDISKNEVKGNSCKRGKEFALEEIVTTKRVVTTTVKVFNKKNYVMLPVKTNKKVDKDLIFKCMKVINKIKINTPIKLGNVIVYNILNTGANVVSTSDSVF